MLLRHVERAEAELGQFRPQCLWDLSGLVPGLRMGRDLGLPEGAGHVENCFLLLAQREIHGSASLPGTVVIERAFNNRLLQEFCKRKYGDHDCAAEVENGKKPS
jgi:hypothetical protein